MCRQDKAALTQMKAGGKEGWSVVDPPLSSSRACLAAFIAFTVPFVFVSLGQFHPVPKGGGGLIHFQSTVAKPITLLPTARPASCPSPSHTRHNLVKEELKAKALAMEIAPSLELWLVPISKCLNVVFSISALAMCTIPEGIPNGRPNEATEARGA